MGLERLQGRSRDEVETKVQEFYKGERKWFSGIRAWLAVDSFCRGSGHEKVSRALYELSSPEGGWMLVSVPQPSLRNRIDAVRGIGQNPPSTSSGSPKAPASPSSVVMAGSPGVPAASAETPETSSGSVTSSAAETVGPNSPNPQAVLMEIKETLKDMSNSIQQRRIFVGQAGISKGLDDILTQLSNSPLSDSSNAAALGTEIRGFKEKVDNFINNKASDRAETLRQEILQEATRILALPEWNITASSAAEPETVAEKELP